MNKSVKFGHTTLVTKLQEDGRCLTRTTTTRTTIRTTTRIRTRTTTIRITTRDNKSSERGIHKGASFAVRPTRENSNGKGTLSWVR